MHLDRKIKDWQRAEGTEEKCKKIIKRDIKKTEREMKQKSAERKSKRRNKIIEFDSDCIFECT